MSAVTAQTPAAPTSPATRLCRAWVRRYTRRLPGDVAGDRRAEIESDLWEHTTDARAHGVGAVRHELTVLRRVVAGMGADLAWRRQHLRAPARAEVGGTDMDSIRTSIAQTGLVVAAAIGMAVGLSLLPLLGSGADGGDSGDVVRIVVWVLVATALSASLGAGLWLRDRRPMAGTVLLVIGALAPSIAWFWLPPMYLLTVVIAVLAIVTTPRRTAEPPATA